MAVGSKLVRIVVAGGNAGGLSAVKNLYLKLLATNRDYNGTKAAPENPNIRITMIDRHDGYIHYLGMTRGLAQLNYGKKLWIPYSDIEWLKHSSIEVKQGIISKITPESLTLSDTKEQIHFDYLIIALGLSRHAPIGVRASTRSEFLHDIQASYNAIKEASSIAVIGGGAVGTELSADIKSEFPDKDVALIHSRAMPIAGPFKDEFRQATVDALHSIGVRTMFGKRVSAETLAKITAPASSEASGILPELVDSVKTNVTLESTDGERLMHADLVFNCLGAKPKDHLFDLPSSTEKSIFSPGGIRTKPTCQIDDPRYPHIFAIGDISDSSQVKLAGAAVASGGAAAENVSRLINAGSSVGVELMEKRSRRDAGMKLVLGDRHAVIQMGDQVMPSDVAINHVSPDIKLSKFISYMCINGYPTEMVKGMGRGGGGGRGGGRGGRARKPEALSG